MALTNKQLAFIDEYLVDFNATQAAIRAGYSPKTAAAIGWENLRKPEIAAEIKRRIAERCITPDEALLLLAEIARANVGDFLKEVKRGRGSRVVFDMERIRKDGRLIKSIAQTDKGVRLEMYSRLEALEKLGRHLGLWNDTPPASVNISIQGFEDMLAREYSDANPGQPG